MFYSGEELKMTKFVKNVFREELDQDKRGQAAEGKGN